MLIQPSLIATTYLLLQPLTCSINSSPPPLIVLSCLVSSFCISLSCRHLSAYALSRLTSTIGPPPENPPSPCSLVVQALAGSLPELWNAEFLFRCMRACGLDVGPRVLSGFGCSPSFLRSCPGQERYLVLAPRDLRINDMKPTQHFSTHKIHNTPP
ncbi:hypothetical protein IWZ01DRAFT_282216 [Phyllosticta capitalensis]